MSDIIRETISNRFGEALRTTPRSWNSELSKIGFVILEFETFKRSVYDDSPNLFNLLKIAAALSSSNEVIKGLEVAKDAYELITTLSAVIGGLGATYGQMAATNGTDLQANMNYSRTQLIVKSLCYHYAEKLLNAGL